MIPPQASLSVSLSLPGAGLVERYNGSEIPRPLPRAREVFEGSEITRERHREGKISSKEKVKKVATDVLQDCCWAGHCGLCLTGQNEPDCLGNSGEHSSCRHSYREAALKILKLPLYSLFFSQQNGDLHQNSEKHSIPCEVLYGNKAVGANPVTSPETHQHGMLCTPSLLCCPQSTCCGTPSWAPSVLSLSPALTPGQQGEHGQFAV